MKTVAQLSEQERRELFSETLKVALAFPNVTKPLSDFLKILI